VGSSPALAPSFVAASSRSLTPAPCYTAFGIRAE
jgi:hypothetical protein